MNGATTIQERLKDLRLNKGLKLEELAEQTGISKSALGSYEKDDYKEINHGNLILLAGLSKQDYITKRLADRQIVVQGNPRVYKALRNQMAEIYEELKHLEKCSEENEELLSTLRLVAETLYGLKGDSE